ncbi:hypothetical protein BDA96_01G062200 [Sorghum bicolor]|uniref:Uncharacterized protein n=2 Tax=Sorghum bicolor TaxID=4558 RepID=A0A921RX69_SORBI|nr:hypothetical protein BDA96_01G062200 [Sorghum bicolor]OQU90850.1 hypothetical protein SORBI_3001G060732 [Sorghum bicolor]
MKQTTPSVGNRFLPPRQPCFPLFASVEQAMSSCLKEVISSRNKAPFLLFHSCQQHNATNMLCCCWGTALIFDVRGNVVCSKPGQLKFPRILQPLHTRTAVHDVFPEEVGSAPLH